MTWWSDGGGRVSAARRPIEGRDKVLRFLTGGMQRFAAGWEFTVAEVNGMPALLARSDDVLTGVLSFDLRGDVISELRAVMNPDKLGFVGRQLARP
ncbi:hypothetical protein ACGH7X_07195 [Streptomyces sp. BBFR51]|uniref:hypothetical protein n=1 Tax=Streptomyces sp. BBFR51 TaxID=3372856 RepID=UPI0037DC29AC